MKRQLDIVRCCANCKHNIVDYDAPECSLSDKDEYGNYQGVEHWNICDRHIFKDLCCLDCNLLNRDSRICDLSNTFMSNTFEQCKLGKTFTEAHKIRKCEDEDMTVESLLQAVMETVVDDEKKRALADRLKAAEERFEESSRSKMVTDEFLSRAYSL